MVPSFLSFRVILDESVISQLAVVLIVARLLLLALTTTTPLFLNTVAGGGARAELFGLLMLLLTALASGFLELVQLSLALGAQRGRAFLLGIASGLELSSLFCIGWAAAIEQCAFAVADSLFVGAAIQSLVIILVVETMMSTEVVLIVLTILWWEGESGHGLLDAIFEFTLESIANSLSTFAACAILFAAGFTTGATAGTSTGCTFLLLGRGSASVAGVAGIQFGLQSFPFGLVGIFGLFVTIFHALVEVFDLCGTVEGQARSNDASDEQRNDDGLHFDWK